MKQNGYLQRALPSLSIALYVFVLVRTAWLCDDAYITLRTVDNFVNGYGLTWNIAERVQAYTHPLWMFLISGVYLFTHEAYYTSIFLSMAVSLAAVVIYARRLAGSRQAAFAGILMLTLSAAFMDYSTSGLENPLTHLLLAAYCYSLLGGGGERRPWLLFLAASLAGLNRPDTLLVFLPSLAYVLWQHRWKRSMIYALAGLMPLIAWEAFSMVYYGFPFPNTAYAKLNTGLPWQDLAVQGVHYLLNSLRWDPITLTTVAGGITAAMFSRDRRLMSIAMGSVLYLAYIVRIGGDFMSGRFLTPMLMCSVILLTARSNSLVQRRHYVLGLALAATALALVGHNPTVLSGADYGSREGQYMDGHGIADERAYYFSGTGLIHNKRPDGLESDYEIFRREAISVRDAGKPLAIMPYIGFYGYYAGKDVHIIDPHALADPLLARLPAIRSGRYRIGHFRRVVPPGYDRSVLENRNLIEDRDLALYYDRLRTITRGDIFSADRFRTILRMNLGMYDHLIDMKRYAYPAD